MKTLKKNWRNHEFSRCYLFFGEETYLIREYEAALRKAILPDGAEMMNEDSFEEKRATAAAIMDAAETLPFLNDKRLVIVFKYTVALTGALPNWSANGRTDLCYLK